MRRSGKAFQIDWPNWQIIILLLILLRHEFLRRDGFAITELQHGHRGRLLTSAPINRRRMVAIEFGMCRSGRNGGASGSITLGNGKLREEHGGGRS